MLLMVWGIYLFCIVAQRRVGQDSRLLALQKVDPITADPPCRQIDRRQGRGLPDLPPSTGRAYLHQDQDRNTDGVHDEVDRVLGHRPGSPLPVWKLEFRTSGGLDHLVELPAERLLFLGRDMVSVPRASTTQTQQLRSQAPFMLTPTQHFVVENSFSLHAIAAYHTFS